MARIPATEIDNYGGGSNSYFSLKNDRDTANVRFMYNSIDDVHAYAIHNVKVDDRDRYVSCLRKYNEPKSQCPMCAAGEFQRVKLYIPLYDTAENEVKVWERGKNFFPKISAICARYSSADVPLVSHTFDIERHGKAGESSTTYEVYETSKDDVTLEDLPEIPEVLGTIILDKTAEDMEYYLDTGRFPTTGGAPVRGQRDEPPFRNSEQPTGRRTPATSRSRGEGF